VTVCTCSTCYHNTLYSRNIVKTMMIINNNNCSSPVGMKRYTYLKKQQDSIHNFTLNQVCHQTSPDNENKIPECNQELCQVQYYMTAACQHPKIEQLYIKSKCGYSILLDTAIRDGNLLGPLFHLTIYWAH
jgi:hypothetical protein